jgi:5'-deoxynucleotidase YfbR-like HD superfamily hydrolase
MAATLQALIKAGYDVTRWHTMQNSRPQNLASHLWGVAMMISRLYDGPPDLYRSLMQACLEHDLAESQIGDMPRPARTEDHRGLEVQVARAMGIMHEEMLPPIAYKWLEWADLIEAGLHAQREAMIGNQNFTEVLLKISEHINAQEQQIPPPLFRFARQAGLIL